MGGPLPESDEEASTPSRPKARVMTSATAGAVAGCIARFLVGPLDVVKIRFQVQLEPIRQAGQALGKAPKYTGFMQALATIFKEEGLQGLWRGTVPGLLLTVPYTAVQFVALQQLKDAAVTYGLTAQPHLAPLLSLGTGALAGAAGTVASYPFDVLRTTMAAQGEPKVYNNMIEAARGIVRERGPVGLYAGLKVTILEIMPYAALQFGLYDGLTAAWKKAKAADVERRKRPTSGGTAAFSESPPIWHDTRMASFVCGLMAGLCAKLATHPLDVAKKRYQIAGLQRSLKYGARVQNAFALQSLGASLAYIFRHEGLPGLWKGSVPSIVKAAPSAAITFTAYEVVLGLLLAAQEKATKS